jgi:biotin carboxyl carrier protein
MENLVLKINNNEYKAHCETDCHKSVIINDKQYEVELLKKFSDNVFSFIVNSKIYQVELFVNDRDTITISLNGMDYKVDVTDSTTYLLEKFIRQSGKAAGSGAGIVKAPMPGLIIKIFVEEGMTVVPGDKLLIVEAMKMENVLKSTIAGKVVSLKVQEGSTVDKDSVLIEIEPS